MIARLTICLGLGTALWAAPVHAQRNAYQAESEVQRLLEDARGYYDNLELEEAEDALARGITMAERFQVRSPVVADVYIQRGVLRFVRDRDEGAAQADFTQALIIHPQAQLDPMLSTPTLERLFTAARQQAGAQSPPPAAPPRQAVGGPSIPRDILHTPPAGARGGQPLPLQLEAEGALNRTIYQIFVHYRSPTAEGPQRVEMTPDGPTTFRAQIPARHMAGRQLQYYIVALDRTQQVVAQVGSLNDAFTVPIQGDWLGDVDSMPSGGSLTGGGGGGRSRGHHFVTLGLSLGTGAGMISDRAQPVVKSEKRISPGFALTPFHVLLEADVWPHERFAIGAFARVQVVEFTHLEGARLKFKAVNTLNHQLILRAGGGFGHVRHLIDLGDDGFDTTLEGPFLYTLGLSYAYRIAHRFNLILTPDFLHMIGDSPSQQFDLQIGVQAAF